MQSKKNNQNSYPDVAINISLLAVLCLVITHFSSADDMSVSKQGQGGLVGDIVPVTVRIDVPAGSDIQWPVIADTLGVLELVAESDPDTITEGEITYFQKLYEFSAYDSVVAVVPEITASYTRPEMDTPNFLTAPGFTLTFTTMAVDTTAPIRDIKDIRAVEYTDNTLWWVLGATLVLAIISFIIYKKYANKPKAVVKKQKKIIPPDVIANNELNALEKAAVWKEARYKKHHTGISDITKTYLEARYVVNATDMTTAQIKQWMERSEISSDITNNTIKWLEIGDLIKFAKYTPLPDENTQPIAAVRALVAATAVDSHSSTPKSTSLGNPDMEIGSKGAGITKHDALNDHSKSAGGGN